MNRYGDFADAIERLDSELRTRHAPRPRRSRASRPKAEVIELFGKRAFDYTFLFEDTERSVVIRRALSMVPHYYYWLMVRVHAVNIVAGTFTLACFNTLPSRQDPREFSIATNNGLSIAVDNGTPAGSLLTDSTSFQGPYFKVELNAYQGFGAPPNFYAELSAVIYARAVG